MKIKILPPPQTTSLEPLTCERNLFDIPVAGTTFLGALNERLNAVEDIPAGKLTLTIHGNLWPSLFLVNFLTSGAERLTVLSSENEPVAWVSPDGAVPEGGETISIDSESMEVVYPWHLLHINEELVGALREDTIKGEISDDVNIDGNVVIGAGTVLLPGVYIEGNAIIGDNCKIGPNCYIRQYTTIGDGCHVGQAVEIKNSILMNKVAAGHLTYLGDSIICDGVNFGAGTITANFRHDGKNHRSMVDGELLDTGRRKFGSIIGDHVHTGIHTSIYPGRKIWPHKMTLPGDIVKKDIK